MDNQVIPLIPEEDHELEANEARNVATSIMDEILNRVVQTKAEVNIKTLFPYSTTYLFKSMIKQLVNFEPKFVGGYICGNVHSGRALDSSG